MNMFNLYTPFSSMCLFILPFLICISRVSVSANGGDLQALLSIKAHIIEDPIKILESWNNSCHFCNWTGVSCGPKYERVVGLNLSGFDLNGALSTSIGNLTFLRDLVLEDNTFYGSIPQEISKLKHLRTFILRNNFFTGEIPKNLSYMLDLTIINLGGNKLTGTIPNGIGSLQNLYKLYIGANQLNGTIPPSIGNLSALQKLGLSYNKLTEYAVGAPATTLVDVYSYGVVLLEMFSGKRPTNNMFKDDFSLHNYVKMAIPDQVMSIADPRLFTEHENNPFRISGDAMKRNAGELEKCLASIFRVGVICCTHAPKDRMEMTDAVLILKTIRDALLKLL